MKTKVDIRNLCNGLDERFLEELNIEAGDGFADTERIRRLAFEKIRLEGKMEKRGRLGGVRRISHKLLLVAALLIVVTTSAFAVGGMDFFRSIFGDSAKRLDGGIQQIGASVKNDDFEMTAEQLVSDGYHMKIIVSLSPSTRQAAEWIKDADIIESEVAIIGGSEKEERMALGAIGTQWMEQFKTKEKAYFCVSYENNYDYAGRPIKLTLVSLQSTAAENSERSILTRPELSLTIDDPKSITSRRTAFFNVTGDHGGSYEASLEVSSISALLTLQGTDGSMDTPTADIVMVMQDGTKERIFKAGSFGVGKDGELASPDDAGEDTLIVENSYVRDPETGKVLQTAGFARIIDPQAVSYILVDGTRYELQ